MTRGRRLSLGVFVAGLMTGSLAPEPARRAPTRVDGYWVLAVDFHVHGFPGDGALAPWLLRDEAARAGLDAFVLSNHNRVSTARAARWLAGDTPGPLVIVGQEVTSRGFHITAAGIERRVDWTRGAAAAIRVIHAQGGAAIANHPARDYWPGWTDEAIALLDGYERAHPSMRTPANAADFAAFSARAVRLKPGIAAIGSSDFHTGGHPGWCRTWVLTRERSVAGVIAAVRDGRTVAVDMNGALYGSPEAIGIVTASGVSAPLPQESGTWQRLSVAAAWLGLLGLALL
ncbi:MAG TPA: hypothetical protein VNN99_04240 [Vicinamibacterales bacterium]|nr:hypothetical protein [Vicinamibacterales bacterium]HXR44415.1 hypothetical protein [Pseudolysinimonas sp.]